jgi:hypothetical protein
MTHSFDIPLCEFFDDDAWDPQEIRDLIQTTPRNAGGNWLDREVAIPAFNRAMIRLFAGHAAHD